MASGVESGSMEVVGNEERPISITGVIETSPSWIAAVLVVMSDTLHHSPAAASTVRLERAAHRVRNRFELAHQLRELRGLQRLRAVGKRLFRSRVHLDDESVGPAG